MDTLRKPLFVAAVILLILAVFAELGSVLVMSVDPKDASRFADMPTPGLGIRYLAILDALVLFTIAIISAPLLIPPRIVGRIQGIISLVVSLLTLLGAITMIVVAIGLLMLMVALFMAVPFGTAVYMVKFGHFDKTAAAATLALVMTLKLAFAGLLVFSQQRFLQNKGLVLIVLCSFLATIILGFLHGFVPGILASITDDIGAIIIAVITAIWALIYLIGSIPAIVKALRVDRTLP